MARRISRICAVTSFLLLIGQLLFLPLSLSLANDTALAIRHEEKRNKIVLSSDLMTAEFEGMKPKVKFYFTQLAEGTETYSLSFFINFKKIIEFHDENGDGVYEPDVDRKARMIEIERLDWTHDAFPVMIEEECVGFAINFTTNSTIHLPKREEQTISVSIIAAMYNVTTIEDPEGFIKANVTISDWPWESEDNRLAMETIFQIHNTTNLPGNLRINVDTDDQGEEYFQVNMKIDEQRIALLRFLKEANNGTRKINVRHSFAATEEGDGFRIWACYDHFQGELVDDPSFGVFEEALPLIRNLLYPLLNRYMFAGAVLATVVVFAVAYKIRRKEIFEVPASI